MLDHQVLLRSAESLPTLPISAARLLEIMNQACPDTKEIIHVISYDPVLTAKLLRLANSAWAGCTSRIGSAKDAVIRLGPATVFGLCMGSVAMPLLTKGAAGYDLDGVTYWRHSVRTALAVQKARRYAGVRWSPFAFKAALLHDLGKLVLGPYLSPFWRVILKEAVEKAGLLPHEAEAEVLGVDHAEVGALVAQHWRLPGVIVKGIGYHHKPEALDDNIGHVIALANGVARRLEGQVGPDLKESLEILAICPDDFDTICEEVGRDADELARQFS